MKTAHSFQPNRARPDAEVVQPLHHLAQSSSDASQAFVLSPPPNHRLIDALALPRRGRERQPAPAKLRLIVPAHAGRPVARSP